MPTTIVKTIGIGGSHDYTSVNNWVAGSPADLTAVDEIWEGDCFFNGSGDGEFTATWNIQGITTDSTRFVRLTTGSGQSFQNNANVRTNALKYNASNGVGHNAAGGNYNPNYICNVNYTQILKQQLRASANGGLTSFTGALHMLVKDCILEDTGNSGAMLGAGNTDAKFINLLIVRNSSFNQSGVTIGSNYGGSVSVIGCTIIRPSDKTVQSTGIGVANSNNTNVVESCAVFGFSTPMTTSGVSTNKNNATDQSAFGAGGSNNQVSVTFNSTTPFTGGASSAMDYRAVAATALAANGFLDSTNAPNDISATARGNPPTIGVWELATAAIPFTAAAYFAGMNPTTIGRVVDLLTHTSVTYMLLAPPPAPPPPTLMFIQGRCG